MLGFIYKITSPSGKIYIGQTINIKKRIRDHKKNRSDHTKLGCSIKKYSWEKHKFEIIEEVSADYCKLLLNLKEIYWIDYYDSYNQGLNLTTGGKGTVGHKHTDETKEILRSKASGQLLSAEAKRKVGYAQKGNKYNIGRSPTNETRKKLSLSGKNRKVSLETRKKLSQANKGKIRSKETRDHLSNTLKGRPISENLRKSLSKKVLCLTNNKEYNSITEASINLNVSVGSILRYFRGLNKKDNVKGYQFKFI